MGEPAETDKPDETPGGRPDTPPGQGGEQPGNRPDVPPGQDKPDKPEKPDNGENGEPAHPITEPGEEPHPEHPITEPGEEPHPAPHAAKTEAPVEALMGFREFMLIAPRRKSVSATSAALAALKRCMRLQGHDIDGHYTVAQWQEYYAEAMSYTGAPVR